MPDISTSNQQKFNDMMCPICHEFSWGSRIAYLTTAGALSSATITAPTITSGSMGYTQLIDMTSYVTEKIFTQYAPSACTGSSADVLAAATAMTSGNYILDPSNASGEFFHLTSAGTSGYFIRLINIATGSTAVINMGASANTVEGAAFIASASGYFGFSIRANSVVDIFCVSATRWVFTGCTAGVAALAPSSA